MGEWIKLKASDDHELSAYVGRPQGEPVGALVVIQEIFGVNASIRSVADEYAEQGFLCVAPALFDRFERDLELGYGEEDMKKAFGLYAQLNPDVQLLDVAAAFQYAHGAGKGTGVIGFCYGGLVSWLTATRGENLKMQPSCCVGYYAGGIGKVATEEPACPVLLHFGDADDHIGSDQVDAVRAAHPEVELFLYAGVGHAFANAARPSFAPEAAALAHTRSLEFLKSHIA